MHPAPITASEFKLHQLNFGWSRNKTIRSNNTRVQPTPESLSQLLQCHESPRHSIVQSHRSCPNHPGPTGSLSQLVPRGPHRGWRNQLSSAQGTPPPPRPLWERAGRISKCLRLAADPGHSGNALEVSPEKVQGLYPYKLCFWSPSLCTASPGC